MSDIIDKLAEILIHHGSVVIFATDFSYPVVSISGS